MSRAAARGVVYPKVGRFCGFCGTGHHLLCPGAGCACDGQAHDPDDALAAWMRLYGRGDLHGDTVEHLAAEYRALSAPTDLPG